METGDFYPFFRHGLKFIFLFRIILNIIADIFLDRSIMVQFNRCDCSDYAPLALFGFSHVRPMAIP